MANRGRRGRKRAVEVEEGKGETWREWNESDDGGGRAREDREEESRERERETWSVRMYGCSEETLPCPLSTSLVCVPPLPVSVL
jgi:hypothetical protein